MRDLEKYSIKNIRSICLHVDDETWKAIKKGVKNGGFRNQSDYIKYLALNELKRGKKNARKN